MELSWSTFLLELINFLVLIWILNYFFYAPIQRTIAKRKHMVQEQLENAQQRHNEAQQLQIKYEHRLADWQQEKITLQKEFQQAMERWKSEEMLHFEKKLNKEQEQLNAREMNKAKEYIEKNAKEALLLAGQFTEKLLIQFADEHLEQKIIEKTIEDLNRYPEKPWQLMADVSEQDTLVVQSAYAINKSQQRRLGQVIEKIMGKKPTIEWVENPALLAGLTLQMGSILLQANLRDELKFFTETNNELTRQPLHS